MDVIGIGGYYLARFVSWERGLVCTAPIGCLLLLVQ